MSITPPADPDLSASVADLMQRHFLVELIDAVLDDDGDGFNRLIEVCGGISGGDLGSISVLFGELSDRLDRDNTALAAILDANSPATAFANAVSTYHEEILDRRR